GVTAGVPLASRAPRRPRLGRWMLGAVNVAQTIPSLALLGFLLPLPLVGGLGSRTALTTLWIYALLPILRTTVSGIQQVDRAVVEAGVAMGMTNRQLLWLVERPPGVAASLGGARTLTGVGV